MSDRDWSRKPTEYTADEMKLFRSTGLPEVDLWARVMHSTNLYKAIAEQCFLNQASGPGVDAFRKVAIMHLEKDVTRDQPEYHQLVKDAVDRSALPARPSRNRG